VGYHHIELAEHDVPLAESSPDMRDGSNYANQPGPVRLYPDHSAWMWKAFGCSSRGRNWRRRRRWSHVSRQIRTPPDRNLFNTIGQLRRLDLDAPATAALGRFRL